MEGWSVHVRSSPVPTTSCVSILSARGIASSRATTSSSSWHRRPERRTAAARRICLSSPISLNVKRTARRRVASVQRARPSSLGRLPAAPSAASPISSATAPPASRAARRPPAPRARERVVAPVERLLGDQQQRRRLPSSRRGPRNSARRPRPAARRAAELLQLRRAASASAARAIARADHRHAHGRPLGAGHRRLRDHGRHGHRAQRLHDRRAAAPLRARRDAEDLRRAPHRRRHAGAERDRRAAHSGTRRAAAPLGLRDRAALVIHDNDNAPRRRRTPSTTRPSSSASTTTTSSTASRTPRASHFWTNDIESCGADAAVPRGQAHRHVARPSSSRLSFRRRASSSTASTGRRSRQTARARAALPRYLEFLRDTQEIGRGVVVGAAGWEQTLEANKHACSTGSSRAPSSSRNYPRVA